MMTSIHEYYLALLLATAIGLCGCRERYTFAAKQFDNPRDALLAQSADAENILAAIEPAKYPIHASVVVYLPNAERIQQTGIRTVGNPNAKLMSFLVTSSERSFDLQAESLRRRKLFDSVLVRKRFEADDPMESEAEYVLWVAIPEVGTGAWYLRRRDWAHRELVPLDTGVPAGLPRMTAWLDTVERIAKGARTDTGVATTAHPGKDPAERLLKLEQLHNQGMITDEEYKKARGRALDDL
jgi:hypothetical protein